MSVPFSPRQALHAFCRDSLFNFVYAAFEELHGPGSFTPAWHVRAICEALDAACYDEDCRRLVIAVPPRHLKSFCAAVALPAFILGHNPGRKVMVATYGQALGQEHGATFRRLIASAWYRATFPQMQVASATADVVTTTAGGGRRAVSVGGAVTGFGADDIIVDDALKASEAASPVERQRVVAFLEGTLLTRFNDPARGRLIAIQQRLHEDDPVGHLVAKGCDRVLTLRAIATEDEDVPIGQRDGRTVVHRRLKGSALYPESFGLDVLEGLRRDLGPAAFAMQFQQDPVAAEGSDLRWEWWGTFEAPLAREGYRYVLQSWDTGSTISAHSDYSVCTTWGLLPDRRWHLLDVLRERMIYPDLKRRVLAHQRAHRADRVLIEHAQSGIGLVQDLCASDPAHRSLFRGIPPEGDKEARFASGLAVIEEGRLLLPRQAPWLAAFRHELMGFPRATHDDQVDSVSQAIRWMKMPRGRGKVADALGERR